MKTSNQENRFNPTIKVWRQWRHSFGDFRLEFFKSFVRSLLDEALGPAHWLSEEISGRRRYSTPRKTRAKRTEMKRIKNRMDQKGKKGSAFERRPDFKKTELGLAFSSSLTICKSHRFKKANFPGWSPARAIKIFLCNGLNTWPPDELRRTCTSLKFPSPTATGPKRPAL